MNIFVTDTDPKVAASHLFSTPKYHSKMAVEASQILSSIVRLKLGKPGIIDQTYWSTRKDKTDVVLYDWTLAGESLTLKSVVCLVSHPNHPCTVWAMQSSDNFLWLLEYALTLAAAYKPKTSKPFKTVQVLDHIVDYVYQICALLPPRGLTEFTIGMKGYETVLTSPVDIYREYLCTVKNDLMRCELQYSH